jgi:hypothetical protein
VSRGLLALGVLATMALMPARGVADDDRDDDRRTRGPRICSTTALLLFHACRSEVRDDLYVAKAKCLNVSQSEERDGCNGDAKQAFREGSQLCSEQREERLEACGSLGEGRYDPDFSPERFDDPRAPSRPNPYFPLGVGNVWTYAGGSERNQVEVLRETKDVDGVTCIVLRDRVFHEGDLMEDTDDWFAAARDGSVWYCGEEVKDFELFDGDDPRLPELVSIDGSFKAGRDGDKAGIIFLADPRPGDVYLEEFSLGNAEDLTEILSTTYAYGADAELDSGVPRELAERFCRGDCVVTRNSSLLEPGVFARKYHARGIGVFLEVDPENGEVNQLVDCNFDPRCENLPQP